MKASIAVEAELFELVVMAALCLWEPRPELQRLCRAAADAGALDDAAIEAVIPGLSARARHNLLRHAIELRLVDTRGALIARGRRCAESGGAPVEELGVYCLLVARHALIGTELLGFRRMKAEGMDRDFDGLEPLPPGFTFERDRVFVSVVGDGSVFGVDDFPAPDGQAPLCRVRALDAAQLDWEIDLRTGANHLRLHGRVGRPARDFEAWPAAIDPDELVDLFSDWESRWDPGKGRLLMDYDDVAGADGRDTFLRDWSCPDLPIAPYGTFEEVAVSDVPVGPRTVAEARRWATAIAVGRVSAEGAYVAPGAWSARWREAIDGTPLAGAGAAPAPTDVTHVDGRPLSARARWLLIAGADLEVVS